MRRKPPQGRSLADRVPEVAAEWHPVLNGELTPHDVFAGSAERFWWQCSTCGHEWATKLEKRVKQGQGCRKCAAARRAKAQATPKPGQSLSDLMPELAAEWHPALSPDRRPQAYFRAVARSCGGSARAAGMNGDHRSTGAASALGAASAPPSARVSCAQLRSRARASPITTRTSRPNGTEPLTAISNRPTSSRPATRESGGNALRGTSGTSHRVTAAAENNARNAQRSNAL